MSGSRTAKLRQEWVAADGYFYDWISKIYRMIPWREFKRNWVKSRRTNSRG